MGGYIHSMSPLLTTVRGYGLFDLHLDEDGRVSDPRINVDGFIHSPYSYNMDEFSELLDPAHQHEIEHHRPTLSDCIISDRSCLCVIPPESSHLFTNIHLADRSKAPTLFLPCGHPGYGYYMDAKSGRRLSGTVLTLFYQNHNRLADQSLCEVERDNIAFTLNDLAGLLGYDTMEDVIENAVPMVPETVQAVCSYTKLFRDPLTALSLRPMIYSYWR